MLLFLRYLCGCLIIAKHILLSITAFGHHLKLITYIFTDLRTWLSILSRFFSWKYNSLLSCFCKTEIPMKCEINGKYYIYVTITACWLFWEKKRSWGIARKREKKKEQSAKVWSFWGQDVLGVRMSQALGSLGWVVSCQVSCVKDFADRSLLELGAYTCNRHNDRFNTLRFNMQTCDP